MIFLLALLKLCYLQIFYNSCAVKAMTDSDLSFEIKYVGCYTDKHERALDEMHRTSTTMTLSICQYHCVGYRYFGVESADECYCGNYPDRHGLAPAECCDQPCLGNSEQVCGGSFCLSVYERLDPQLAPGYIEPYDYLGCYEDRRDRILSVTKTGMTVNGMRMNILLCRYLCDGHTFFGLEYRNECYCGNEKKNYPLFNSSCTMTCNGADTQFCGGKSKISIYRTKEYDQENTELKHVRLHYLQNTYSTYIGCYSARKNQFLIQRKTYYSMSVDICDKLCYKSTYFAIQNGFDCYCGELYGTGPSHKQADMLCNVLCDTNEFGEPMGCGGENSYSVYRTTYYPLFGDTVTYQETYIGCFRDDVNDRDLPVLRRNMSDLTVSVCQELCFDHSFFGIQSGRECWCGHRYGKHGSVDNRRCNSICEISAQYSLIQCGGVSINSVYKGLNAIINVHDNNIYSTPSYEY